MKAEIYKLIYKLKGNLYEINISSATKNALLQNFSPCSHNNKSNSNLPSITKGHEKIYLDASPQEVNQKLEEILNSYNKSFFDYIDAEIKFMNKIIKKLVLPRDRIILLSLKKNILTLIDILGKIIFPKEGENRKKFIKTIHLSENSDLKLISVVKLYKKFLSDKKTDDKELYKEFLSNRKTNNERIREEIEKQLEKVKKEIEKQWEKVKNYIDNGFTPLITANSVDFKDDQSVDSNEDQKEKLVKLLNEEKIKNYSHASIFYTYRCRLIHDYADTGSSLIDEDSAINSNNILYYIPPYTEDDEYECIPQPYYPYNFMITLLKSILVKLREYVIKEKKDLSFIFSIETNLNFWSKK